MGVDRNKNKHESHNPPTGYVGTAILVGLEPTPPQMRPGVTVREGDLEETYTESTFYVTRGTQLDGTLILGRSRGGSWLETAYGAGQMGVPRFDLKKVGFIPEGVPMSSYAEF